MHELERQQLPDPALMQAGNCQAEDPITVESGVKEKDALDHEGTDQHADKYRRVTRRVVRVPHVMTISQHRWTTLGSGWGLFQRPDRKSTRLNSSHLVISYAVFCL